MSSPLPSPPPPTTSPSPSSPPPPSSSSDDPSPTDDGETDSSSVGTKKSNYYFFKSTPAHEAHKYMPTLLTSSSPAPSTSPTPLPSHPSPSPSPEPAAGSRWNAAGTWEEKDLSSWAHNRLTSLLSFPSSTPSVKVTKVTGDATLVFTRGKKKVGYDVAVVAEWVGKVGGEEVKGGLELPSLDQTNEGDFEMIVTVKEKGKAGEEGVESLVRSVKKMKEKIANMMEQFEKELKEQ